MRISDWSSDVCSSDLLAMRAGLRGPTRVDIPFMIEAARKTAWATDKGMTIANGVVTALRDARILLPSISTIERASIAGRARARKQAAYALIARSEEHTSELQSLMRISYAVFCLNKIKQHQNNQ